MKRPILIIFIFLTIGIILGRYISSLLIIALLVFSLNLVCFYFNKFFKIKKIKFAILINIPIFIGLVLIFNSIKPKDNILDNAIDNKSVFNIIGTITEKDVTTSSKIKLKIKANTFKINSDLNIQKNINILVYANYDKNYEVGQEVFLKTNLKKVQDTKTSNEYSQFESLKSKKIEYIAYTDNIYINGIKNKFYNKLYKLKDKIGKIYYELLPNDEASILKAMIVGDKSEVSETISSSYSNAGVYHLFAISGLHISILATILCFLFNKINYKYGKFVVIFILVLYCIFTGAKISTIRATIMFIVLILDSIFKRKYDMVCATCFSAIVILVYEPMYLFNLGFIYSFIAVFAIGLIVKRLDLIFKINYFVFMLIASFFVSYSIKPIVLNNTYEFCYLDIFLNIIFIPFMSIVIGLGILATFVYFINFGLAKLIILPVYYILRFFNIVCGYIDEVNFFKILIGKPEPLFLLFYYLVFIAIIFVLYDKYLIRKRLKYFKIALSVFLVFLIIKAIPINKLSFSPLSFFNKEFLLFKHSGTNVVLNLDQNLKNKNYEKQFELALKKNATKEIDIFIINDIEKNEFEKINHILEKTNVKTVVMPKIKVYNEQYENFLKIIYKKQINLFEFDVGDSIKINKNFNIYFLKDNNLKINFFKNDMFIYQNEDYNNVLLYQKNKTISFDEYLDFSFNVYKNRMEVSF